MTNTDLTRAMVRTDRISMNVWTSGPQDGRPVLLVHGNLTTGGFWRYVAQCLPADVRVVAPDLRGFGRTQQLGIDATRGLGDMADDVRSLLDTLGLSGGDRRVVAAGWSMGGGVLQQYLLMHPGDLAGLVLAAPLSPYGFGGTTGTDGRPCTPDHAGTGGGTAVPDFVRRLAEHDTSSDEGSPRVVLRSFYGAGANAANVDEEFLLQEALLTAVGDDFYPGTQTASPHWPSVAPGERGVLNAMSPKYFRTTQIVDLDDKPAVTWIRAMKDQVVSDESMFDFGTLGKLGLVPGWPGPEVMPPQPMHQQIAAVLQAYAEHGGDVREVRLDHCAHGIPLEDPQAVADAITTHLDA